MSQREQAFNSILIYKQRYKLLQLLPTKTYKRTRKAQYFKRRPKTLLIRPLTSAPFHLPPPIKTLALTLFITLKGWETGILHLGGLTKMLTLLILYRYSYTYTG